MKRIGILGGMSAASSQLYYKILCELTQKKFGGLNSPEILLRSLNFAPLAECMNSGEWRKIGAILNQEALRLRDGGADFIVLATNTMHKMADEMMAGVDIPLLHIADATAEKLVQEGIKKPAFIATKFTMEERFYLDKLEGCGLEPLVPNQEQRQEINRIIFEELCRGEVHPASQKKYVEVVHELTAQGADSVILGCTEVCMLLNESNTGIPTFDTTYLHCEAALAMASE